MPAACTPGADASLSASRSQNASVAPRSGIVARFRQRDLERQHVLRLKPGSVWRTRSNARHRMPPEQSSIAASANSAKTSAATSAGHRRACPAHSSGASRRAGCREWHGWPAPNRTASRCRRREHGESEDARVQIEAGPRRHLVAGSGEQETKRPASGDQPDRAADGGEREILHEQLPRQPRAAGADGEADAHLTASREGPREHHAGDVGAGDDEQHDDGAERAPAIPR